MDPIEDKMNEANSDTEVSEPKVNIPDIERTKTYIDGLDNALNGGIPKGNIVLVSGGAGTGKSTLCLQFAINGAKKKEKALYISTEQNREELIKQAKGFNWDVPFMEKQGHLKLVFLDITAGDSFLEKIHSMILEYKPERIVIDSLTTLTDSMLVSGITDDKGFSMVQIAETVNPIPRTEKIIAKSLLYKLFSEIKKHKVTTLLTTELPEDHKQLSADGISEFVTDGVVLLKAINVGGTFTRSMEVRKMRYTPMDSAIQSYSLLGQGIVIE